MISNDFPANFALEARVTRIPLVMQLGERRMVKRLWMQPSPDRTGVFFRPLNSRMVAILVLGNRRARRYIVVDKVSIQKALPLVV
jgi:hypothetical protein